LSREQFEVGVECLHESSSQKSLLEEISTCGQMFDSYLHHQRGFVNDPQILTGDKIPGADRPEIEMLSKKGSCDHHIAGPDALFLSSTRNLHFVFYKFENLLSSSGRHNSLCIYALGGIIISHSIKSNIPNLLY
jgi:hypothetical protein